ncbi:TrbC family F-type conjugative pilus assembly protein [Methylocaldum szegediense]|uniref:TrbC family F-type conjugative pilus assembly protein n=1 Tax=Methylocaldum szegediense TaxID=73780 RepID=UPI00040825E7|nr:TrbC family F-type conjugative pilus assembly protein [Methylocaldum szegediense]
MRSFDGIRVVALVLAAQYASGGWAEEDWLTRSLALLEALRQAERPAWLDRNPHREAAERQARETVDAAPKPDLPGLPVPPPGGAGRRIVIYVSSALGRDALKDVFEAAAGQSDVLIVFRGPRPGQKITTFVAELRDLLKEIEPAPNVGLDPHRFRTHDVTTVPVMMLEDGGRVLARVRGVTGIDWFRRQLAAGRRGDLGAQGPVLEVAEIDLIEEMQRRLAAIDWHDKKRQALTRFWDRARFVELPETTENRDRSIDLTVTAPRDLIAPDGTVVVRAGETVNPLDKRPFTLRMVVFDGTRPDQVETAARLGQEADGKRVVYITTRLEREDGWNALAALERRLENPVYLLTPDVRSRFQLERVPAVVEADGTLIRVRELRPDRTERPS